MAILPRDLLDQAFSLIAQSEVLPDVPSRGAILRAAVSRAYCAVYHEALARARREGYVGAPVGRGSHEGIWQWWFVSERLDLPLADAENILKAERTLADYRLREVLSPSRAKAVVRDARATFELVRARGTNP